MNFPELCTNNGYHLLWWNIYLLFNGNHRHSWYNLFFQASNESLLKQENHISIPRNLLESWLKQQYTGFLVSCLMLGYAFYVKPKRNKQQTWVKTGETIVTFFKHQRVGCVCLPKIARAPTFEVWLRRSRSRTTTVIHYQQVQIQ